MKKEEFHQINKILEMPELTEKDIVSYVIERFADLKAESSMGKLVQFHTDNKYLLMAHSQVGLLKLGNIVSNHAKLPLEHVLKNYEDALENTLKKEPTTKSHINVLMHIFGYFGKNLNQKEKDFFMKLIKKYKENRITLGKILSEIEPITYKFNNLYLISQTYFLLYSDAKMGNMFEVLSLQSN
ncbi:MAG: YbgA family protein [Nitrosopumilaceae archaeon]|nr:YbgA family protein [Nitrosopumilaceae archaeon]